MSKKEIIYISADWHPTYEPPKGRVESEEEWMELQTDAVRQVAKIVGEDLLIIAGDLVDSYKQKNAQLIVNMLNDNLPKNTIITMGNHAVYGCGQDRDKALSEGTFGTLTRMKNINYITAPYEYGPYTIYPHDFKHGETIEHNEVDTNKINVALGHFLSFNKQLPHWAKEGDAWLAQDIIKEFPEYNLIVVGDNHETFNIDNRYLSPGSLTRRTIRQDKHLPCIHKYDGTTVEPIYLKVKPAEECITKEHKIQAQAKIERMEEWGESLKEKQSLTGDFKDDLQEHFKVNKTPKDIKDMLEEIIMEVEQ